MAKFYITPEQRYYDTVASAEVVKVEAWPEGMTRDDAVAVNKYRNVHWKVEDDNIDTRWCAYTALKDALKELEK